LFLSGYPWVFRSGYFLWLFFLGGAFGFLFTVIHLAEPLAIPWNSLVVEDGAWPNKEECRLSE
tara:strand:- start:509 stop:697 length:189 start_codon:yes stop_codon:yes gene_type:complete